MSVSKKEPVPDSVSLEQLSVKNRQAWDELYRETDRPVWGNDPVEVIAECIEKIPGSFGQSSRILDAATGEGRNLSLLLNLSGRMYCCDASFSALAKIPQGVRSQTDAACCDLLRAPFQSDSFDFILAWDIMETLPDPFSFLKELRRILKPGGTLLCNVTGKEELKEGNDVCMIDDDSCWYRGRYYLHYMDSENAAEMFESAGFDICEHTCCRWRESAHVNYREETHTHTSTVFLVSAGLKG